MAQFSDLPNEVLVMIWYTADVKDVYNFSTTSKQLYSLFKNMLPKHLKLLRRLSFLGNCDQVESNYFAHILEEILLDPEAARYPSNIPDVGDDSPHREVPEAALLLFEDALKKSDIDGDDQITYWVNEIHIGNEDPLIALLIILLPNLTMIRYMTQLQGDFVWFVLDNNFLRRGTPTFLKNLHSIEFDYAQDRELKILRSKSDESCMEIYGHSITSDGINGTDMLITDLSLPFSKIIILILTECAIHPKQLSELLHTINGLQYFTYTARGTDSNDNLFEPYWICTALQAYQRLSLKSLKMLANGQPANFMGSAEFFDVLEDLEIDLGLLLGNVSKSEVCIDIQDLLPRSIKSLKILLKDLEDAHIGLVVLQHFKESLEGKIFPNLAEITLLGNNDMGGGAKMAWAELVAGYRDEGVLLSFESPSKG